MNDQPNNENEPEVETGYWTNFGAYVQKLSITKPIKAYFYDPEGNGQSQFFDESQLKLQKISVESTDVKKAADPQYNTGFNDQYLYEHAQRNKSFMIKPTTVAEYFLPSITIEVSRSTINKAKEKNWQLVFDVGDVLLTLQENRMDNGTFSLTHIADDQERYGDGFYEARERIGQFIHFPVTDHVYFELSPGAIQDCKLTQRGWLTNNRRYDINLWFMPNLNGLNGDCRMVVRGENDCFWNNSSLSPRLDSVATIPIKFNVVDGR